MAQKVQVLLVDDMDGTDAVETVSFALDGREFEIDLSESNATALRSALRPFADKARRATSTKRATPAARRRDRNSNASKIRAWAMDNGHEVPTRGRIPQAIADAYAAAHR